jgi:hypothetical protein
MRWWAGLVVIISLTLSGLACAPAGPGQAPAGGESSAVDALPSAPAPSVDLRAVDDAVRGLPWGTVAFNPPSTMGYQERRKVEVVLSPSMAREDLQTQLRNQTESQFEDLQISDQMEAWLTGGAFEIRPLTPNVQPVGSDQPTRWEWEIKALEQGKGSLYLTISAHLTLRDEDMPKVVKTLDKEIEVEVSMLGRVGDAVAQNAQWLWTAILVPVAGFLFRRLSKRGRRMTRARKPARTRSLSPDPSA